MKCITADFSFSDFTVLRKQHPKVTVSSSHKCAWSLGKMASQNSIFFILERVSCVDRSDKDRKVPEVMCCLCTCAQPCNCITATSTKFSGILAQVSLSRCFDLLASFVLFNIASWEITYSNIASKFSYQLISFLEVLPFRRLRLLKSEFELRYCTSWLLHLTHRDFIFATT